MGEIIVILFILVVILAIFVAFFFLAKYLIGAGGKACPHCAEKIKEAAKVCPYCRRDVTGV
jgi:hypothetical protein